MVIDLISWILSACTLRRIYSTFLAEKLPREYSLDPSWFEIRLMNGALSSFLDLCGFVESLPLESVFFFVYIFAAWPFFRPFCDGN